MTAAPRHLFRSLSRTTNFGSTSCYPHWRSFSSVNGSSKTEIYASTSHDPYFNLAFEDWLFRSSPVDSTVLLFYRNRPSIIIGRNQNPWKEINFHALRRTGIPFVRRRSGGGTVYHDLGNTNYSIAMPRVNFDRTSNAELVARGVAQSLDVPAYVNDRNDIVVDGFKVSGSAYKIVSKRAYHHGTMLISARLNDLGDLLRNTKSSLVTKGVDSVRSPVRNLQNFNGGVTHERFVEAVSRSFRETYGGSAKIQEVHEVDYASNDVITKGREELESWEWTHGQTPEFTHELIKSFPWGDVTIHIHSKKGIILDSSISYLPSASASPASSIASAIEESKSKSTSATLNALAKVLPGIGYGFIREEDLETLRGVELGMRGWEVVDWLREEM